MRFCFKFGLVLVTSDWNSASVMWASQSTPAQCMFAQFARLSPCAKTEGVTVIHFLVVQTATISVATAGDFLLDPGFSCFILDLFDSNQILEIYVVVLYFHSRIQ